MRTGDYVLEAIRKGEIDTAIEKVFRNPIHAKIHGEFLVKEGYAVSIDLLLKSGQSVAEKYESYKKELLYNRVVYERL